jgi:hypothetical protein
MREYEHSIAFPFPRETKLENKKQKYNVLAEENLFNVSKTPTMLDRFCEHCCFVIILFFSKANRNQLLLELKVIEDKRRYISFSALF